MNKLLSTAQQKRIAFALLMGCITTMIISFSIVLIHVGITDRFVPIWLRSWLTAYLFVIPTILYLAPVVQRLINRWFADADEERNSS